MRRSLIFNLIRRSFHFEIYSKYFFVIHDPTTLNYQGHDHGTQYRSVIFTHSDEQAKIAHEVIQELEDSRIYANPVVTQIEAAPTIYPAEDYHQNYFQQHPYQGHCAAVVAPKLAKFRAKFKSLIHSTFNKQITARGDE